MQGDIKYLFFLFFFFFFFFFLVFDMILPVIEPQSPEPLVNRNHLTMCKQMVNVELDYWYYMAMLETI